MLEIHWLICLPLDLSMECHFLIIIIRTVDNQTLVLEVLSIGSSYRHLTFPKKWHNSPYFESGLLTKRSFQIICNMIGSHSKISPIHFADSYGYTLFVYTYMYSLNRHAYISCAHIHISVFCIPLVI
jgi:hypothetical protein